MQFLRAEGYPLPEVFEVNQDGAAITMERLEGPSMLADLESRPWRLRRHAALLAGLHEQLHAIRPPAWLGPAPGSAGDRLLHLDLHPLNVLLSSRGPVVIDWTNARRGNPPVDVAATWVLLAAAGLPTGGWRAVPVEALRGAFLRSFLGHFDLASVRSELSAVVEWKVGDANMSARERRAMSDLARRETRRPA